MLDAKELGGMLDNMLGENAEASKVKGWIDTGIAETNFMVGSDHEKGLPQGRVIEIFGPSGSGKTFLATQAMAAVQKQGGIAFFSDHERSFDPALAESLGLDLSPNKFRHLKPETFEDSVDLMWSTAQKLRKAGLDMDIPCIWVFDSVAAMIPKQKLYDDDGNYREVGSFKMNDSLSLAKSCSQSYPTLKMFAEDCNFCVLLLNQIRMKPGVMYGDPTTTPGGQAAEFYADVRISLGKSDITEGKGKDKKHLGFEIKAKCIKNKVARPHRSSSWKILFNEHKLGVTIDQVATNLDYLIRLGLVEKSGNRIVWEGKKLYPKQLIALLKVDPKGNDKLLKILKDQDDIKAEEESEVSNDG